MNAIAELDHREGNGISVTLLWNRQTDSLVVRVSDEKTGEQFELAVAPEEALQVFHHPFAYTVSRPARYLTTDVGCLT